jgi:hypothetical protein
VGTSTAHHGFARMQPVAPGKPCGIGGGRADVSGLSVLVIYVCRALSKDVREKQAHY